MLLSQVFPFVSSSFHLFSPFSLNYWFLIFSLLDFLIIVFFSDLFLKVNFLFFLTFIWHSTTYFVFNSELLNLTFSGFFLIFLQIVMSPFFVSFVLFFRNSYLHPAHILTFFFFIPTKRIFLLHSHFSVLLLFKLIIVQFHLFIEV